MKRYWSLASALLALFLTSYLLVLAFDVSFLNEPELGERGALGAVIGIGLLVADQFVPVGSSVVMLSLGAIYGAPAGVALALVGRVGMAAVGFAIGRRSRGLLDRLVPLVEQERPRRLLERHGAMAILVSRPVPLLGETIVILAGASRLGWGRAMVAALVGSVPEAIAYSLVGAIAPSYGNAGVIWASFLLLVTAFWLGGRLVDCRAAGRADTKSASTTVST